jgi:serine/threonine protein kinase
MALDTSKPEMQSIGSYDLIAKIAEGGMGWVYKGRHRQTGQLVAIKIVPSHMARNEILLKRFEQEFIAASKLDHPNIVRALDYCGTGSTPFLVMEFVDGESLGQRLDRDGKMPEAEAIRIIAQVAQGLHRAHKMGMIHRDVKPDNVMVTRDGTAKLTDLGLVKEIDAELNLTRTGRGLGTPHFMAPEQFRNAKNADVRCDVYSLAATLYHMVTGELPFGKTSGPLDAWMKKVNNDLGTPRQLAPEISERTDWAIRRSMAADPNLRPGSCREFVEDLTGHSTRKLSTPTDGAQSGDIWYLVYKDETGATHTVKGSTEGIRRSLRERLLGDATNVRACRSKTGPFEPLKGFPEFRDLLIAPSTATPTGDSGQVIGAPLSAPSTGPSSNWGAARTTPESKRSTEAPHIRIKASDGGQNLLVLAGMFVVALMTALVAMYFLFLRG